MAKINANVICDISKFTDEEIFGKDSIRDHAVVDSKNPNAKGYQKFTITGSQAGVVMGLSHWQSPLELCAIKQGKLEQPVIENDEVLKAGHAAEDFVANMFARKMVEEFGDRLKSVSLINDTNMYQSKERPWQLADCDRFAILTFKSGKEMFVGLECKTCYNTPSIKAWKDGIVPPTYEAQCRHYMSVTNVDAWYICCCWGFTINDCAVKLIRRDMDKEKALIECEETFIECCREGYEPAIPTENLELTTAYYNKVYGGLKDNEEVLEDDDFSNAILADCKSLQDKQQNLKALDNEVSELKNKIAAELIKKSGGNARAFIINKGEDTFKIGLAVPMKKDTVDIDKLKAEMPEAIDTLSAIGLSKITKTDLGKIKKDGKKIDATPYIVPGGANIDKPIYVEEVKTWKNVDAS